VRLNGVSTHNLVENLIQTVLKLSEDVQQLRKGNEHLKHYLSKIPVPSADGLESTVHVFLYFSRTTSF
jgi:hypothetical protein